MQVTTNFLFSCYANQNALADQVYVQPRSGKGGEDETINQEDTEDDC